MKKAPAGASRNTGQAATSAAAFQPHHPAVERVEMRHPHFERLLIGPDLVPALGQERLAAAVGSGVSPANRGIRAQSRETGLILSTLML